MSLEQFVNLAASTLNGAINNSVTSLVITSATGFPTVPQFRIIIDTEIMLVTAVSGTTYTVTRGAEGTTAASHSDLAPLTHVLTAASLLAIIAQNGPSNPSTTFKSSDFTAVNGNADAALTDKDGAILATFTGSGSETFRLWERSFPATSVTAAFRVTQCMANTGTPHSDFFFGMRDSISGSSEGFCAQWTTGFAIAALAIELIVSNVRNTSEHDLSVFNGNLGATFWVKAEITGGNMNFYYSDDGIDFIKIYGVATPGALSNTPDQVVWGGSYWQGASGNFFTVKLVSWVEA